MNRKIVLLILLLLFLAFVIEFRDLLDFSIRAIGGVQKGKILSLLDELGSLWKKKIRGLYGNF